MPLMLSRLLRPVVQLREGEATTAVLMFAYSFLAMTSYNVIKPLTRGEFIAGLGVLNLPWAQFGTGILIGFIMQGYSKAVSVVPKRWTIPVTQAGMAGLLLLFWLLFTTARAQWVSAGFYVLAAIFGILFISQFWTLANDVYDPRQAKRIFGFIGAGASLGGATGAGLTAYLVERVGTESMLLVSAGIMAVCLLIVITLVRREQGAGLGDAGTTGENGGVSGAEAIQLLTSSRHLQIISVVIAFGAIAAAIIEQQLNMAAAEAKGAGNADAISAFLAQVTVYLSLIGFAIQIGATSRIHRILGIGFALLILPVSFGTTAAIMLVNRALWAPGLARITDTALRYTVDKTSREVLFLPLPAELKYRAKPFVDVTMDRLAKGAGALFLLVLINDWGLGLDWQQLSYVSLTIMGVWILVALRARKEYMMTFRRSIERQDVQPAEIALNAVDPASVEMLVSELAHPEPRHVLYAIDLLESMNKRHLITPLLLSHDSAEVRERALKVAASAGATLADRWLPGVQRALADPEAAVRIAAVTALAALRGRNAAEVMRPYLASPDPALASVAAAALADSGTDADKAGADETFRRFSADTRDQSAPVRRLMAQALGHVKDPAFRQLLLPLMYDANTDVARAAVASAGTLGGGDFLFVAPLVALLRNRALKSAARQVLVGYGDEVVAPLAHFMLDPEEDVWVRRHVPATLAQLPGPASMAALLAALDSHDGFLRFKALDAIEHIRRTTPSVAIDQAAVTRHVVAEAGRAFDALTLHYNLVVAGEIDSGCLLARALDEKHRRAMARLFQMLGLVHPAGDVDAVRQTLLQGDARLRSSAIEYLDNLLAGDVRKKVMVLVEEMPLDERIRKGNVIHRTRTRDVEDTLAQLLHDDDQTLAAAAIHLVEARKQWTLADDIEHVLAHRDARDWHVFEAASWALAAHRMPAERRRSLWQEPLPAVELADRLRRIPLFEFTSVDELFRLAGLGRQVRHDQGRDLYTAGEAPQSLQFLLDGRLRRTGESGAADLEPPAPLAFEQVLEGMTMPATITAIEASITLSLTTGEFLTHLAENADLAKGLFHMLLAPRNGERAAVQHWGIPREVRERVASGLRPIDRVLLFQSSSLLSRASATALLQLAGISRPVSWTAGTQPFARDAEPALLVVLTGELQVTQLGGKTETAGAGDVVGLHETLGSVPLTATVTVSKDATVLKIDRADLFDVLANHIDLMQGVFSGILRS